MATDTRNPDELLSPRQIEAEFGIPTQTQANWRANQRYGWPYTKVGRSVRTRRRDVEAWIESRTLNPAAE
jgi:transposase